jgi:hypothetical protein
MLTLDKILVALPALATWLALLGYGGLILLSRKAQQSRRQVRPIPVTSRKRRDSQG